MNEPTAGAICACLYPALNEIAHTAGYALAVRAGRDLDLVAVPWISDAIEPAELVARIVDYFSDADRQTLTLPLQRPHGRLTWTIPIGWYGTTIALSVMPPSAYSVSSK